MYFAPYIGHRGQTPTGVNDLDIMRFSAPFMLFCPGGRTLERERKKKYFYALWRISAPDENIYNPLYNLISLLWKNLGTPLCLTCLILSEQKGWDPNDTASKTVIVLTQWVALYILAKLALNVRLNKCIETPFYLLLPK